MLTRNSEAISVLNRRPFAAVQADAAEDHRGEHREQEVGAHRGLGPSEARHLQHAGEPGQGAGQHEHRELHPRRPDTGTDAAGSLSPVAYTWAPNRVRVATTEKTMYSPRATRAITGIPRTLPR